MQAAAFVQISVHFLVRHSVHNLREPLHEKQTIGTTRTEAFVRLQYSDEEAL
jgi:hypothetical protein